MRGLGEWIFWGVVETSKYILVVGGILGFPMKTGWKKYWAVLYLVIMIPSVVMLEIQNSVEYRMAWGLILISSFFAGEILDRVKAFFFSWILISLLDMAIWSVLANILSFTADRLLLNRISDFAGCLCWLCIIPGLRKYRKKIFEYFLDIPFGWFIMMIAGVFILGVMGAAIQSGVYVTFSMEEKRKIFVIYMCGMIFLIIGCIAFVYSLVSKRRLKKIHEVEQINLKLQQKYYESRLQQNEEIIKFRHDIKKHMKIINLLCENNETEELKSYIAAFLETYPEYEIVYTGNYIADFFIGELLNALQDKQNFSYSITGRFPEKIPVSNVELSILLANVLENAKNALLQIEEKSKLVIQVGHYKGHMVIDVQNSRSSMKVDEIKEREGYHGYGLRNIQTVVDKYGGSMKIQKYSDWFAIKIVI